ncbi:MAG: hypothetical protein H6551_03855 [Chitinophagales bacterium]|nr:hypothetical protein [Chitinophagales bacterium]
MLRYSISILFILLSVFTYAQDVEEEAERPQIKDSTHQLRLGVDAFKIVTNQLQTQRQSYELIFDYYWKKDLYFVAEGGWGNAQLDYTDLAYKSSNTFFKLGFDKSILSRLTSKDWDLAFIGLRYGMGLVERGDAFYSITDSLWGTTSGTVAGTNFTAHWLEITGGVRVEMVKNIFVGWNVRGKFILNGKKFKELPPYYIAGYGNGEKNTIFDFNVYLCYAIRWKMKHPK